MLEAESMGFLVWLAVRRSILSKSNTSDLLERIHWEERLHLKEIKQHRLLYMFHSYFLIALILLVSGPVLDSILQYPIGWLVDVGVGISCEYSASIVLDAILTKLALPTTVRVLFDKIILAVMTLFALSFFHGYLNIMFVQ